MRVFTVQVRPADAGKRARAVLLRDGFAFWAFVAPVLWFLFHRCFALAGITLATMLVLGALLPSAAAAALTLGLQLFIGFEARTLQGWWLGLRGWRTEAVVMGRDAEACEERRAGVCRDQDVGPGGQRAMPARIDVLATEEHRGAGRKRPCAAGPRHDVPRPAPGNAAS